MNAGIVDFDYCNKRDTHANVIHLDRLMSKREENRLKRRSMIRHIKNIGLVDSCRLMGKDGDSLYTLAARHRSGQLRTTYAYWPRSWSKLPQITNTKHAKRRLKSRSLDRSGTEKPMPKTKTKTKTKKGFSNRNTILRGKARVLMDS